MGVMRHWLVYPPRWPSIDSPPVTVVHLAPERRPGYRVEGPFVLEAQQPQGAVAENEKLRDLLQRVYPRLGPDDLSVEVEDVLGIGPFDHRGGQ